MFFQTANLFDELIQVLSQPAKTIARSEAFEMYSGGER